MFETRTLSSVLLPRDSGDPFGHGPAGRPPGRPGVIEARRFYESPFTNLSPTGRDALFLPDQVDRLVSSVGAGAGDQPSMAVIRWAPSTWTTRSAVALVGSMWSRRFTPLMPSQTWSAKAPTATSSMTAIAA